MSEENLFRGTRGPQDAKIVVIGEYFGKTDADLNIPFSGESGKELFLILEECGYDPKDIFFTTLLTSQPRANNIQNNFYSNKEAARLNIQSVKGLFPQQSMLDGVKRVQEQLLKIQPTVVIGLGSYVSWALTEKSFSVRADKGYKIPSGIAEWRGSQLYTSTPARFRYLPSYSPSAIIKNWPWRYMLKHDINRRVAQALEDDWDKPETRFIVRPNFEKAMSTLRMLVAMADEGPLDLSTDIETRDTMIACIGFAWTLLDAICIPWMCIERKTGYWSIDEEVELRKIIKLLLQHPNTNIIGQNFSYDAQYIHEYDFYITHIGFDTMIAHHLCWPGGGDPSKPGNKTRAQGIQRKGLNNLSSLYCKHHVYWKDESKTWNFSLPEEQLWIYNCKDTVNTLEVKQALQKLIKELNFTSHFQERMDIANEVALPMMFDGIRIDKKAKANMAFELSDAIAQYSEEIDGLIPEDVHPRKKKAALWFRSSAQQKEIFYDKLGLKPIRFRGKVTMNKEALVALGNYEPLLAPIFERIEILRSLGVFFGTFIQAKLDEDGRMRSEYAVTGTDTFRWSSRKNAFERGANLQNIPKGDEEDTTTIKSRAMKRFPNVRKLFIPDPGYEFMEVDLAGADAQVVAWEAEDEDLKAAFRAGLKLHLKNARDIYPELTENMTDEEIKDTDHPGGIYHNCKKRVHATNYGITAKSLARATHASIQDEEMFQERWFHLHPGIKTWHKRVEEELAQSRTVSNPFGYRIVYFDRMQGLLNKGLAWSPQSTVAIVCSRSSLILKRKCPWVQILLQVHDSLGIQYKLADVNKRDEIKKAISTVIVPFKEPLLIPWTVKISRSSWGEMKDMKWDF